MKRTSSSSRPWSALPPQPSKDRPASLTRKPNLNVASGSLNNLNSVVTLDPFSTSNKSNALIRSPPLTGNTNPTQSKSKITRIKKLQKANTERQPFEELSLPPAQSSQAFASLNLSSPSYRFVQPQAQKVDISQKLWMDAVEKSTGLVSNPLTSPPGMRPKSGISSKDKLGGSLPREERSGEFRPLPGMGSTTSYGNENFEERSIGMSKPFSFLSTVGGKNTTLSEVIGEGPPNKRPATGIQQSRRPVKDSEPGDISIFVNSNVDKVEKTQEKKPKLERPQTVGVSSLITRHESAGALKATKHVIIRPQKQPGAPDTKPEESSLRRPGTASEAMLRKTQSANIRISSSKGRLTSANILSGGRKKIDSAMRTGGQYVEGVEAEELQDEFESLGIKEDLEDDDEVYQKMDAAKNLKKNTSRLFSSARPISGIRAGPEEFFANFAKFTNFAEMENVYEELFDRNERTLAATFAKFGDLGYYSPLQRIGSYMQYSSKLKKEHLDEIIDFLKTVTSVEKPEFEVPIQLAIIDELDPYQNRQKTGISTTFHAEDITREPLTLSLYPEYIDLTDMPKDMENFEAEGTASQLAAQRYFENILEQMNGNYDPQYLGKDNYLYVPPEQWPKNIRDRIILSYKRYNHYIHSDEIKHDEISKFKKEWITNALSLISEPLLKNYEESVRKMFQEIFENYKTSMKESIVDYILLNPDERKRLNITLLVQHTPCSAERIAKEGGFSNKLYPAWHDFVENGKSEMKVNSYQLSVVTSAILDWYEDFAALSLFEHVAVNKASRKGYTLDIPSFKRLETSYRFRTVSQIQHIFYRGVILILKKCKQLRRKQPPRGQWTYDGFKTRAQLLSPRTGYAEEQGTTDPSYLSFTGDEHEDRRPLDSNQFYNDLLYSQLDMECNFREDFDYFKDIQTLEELQDIRESPAYRVYSVLADSPLHLEENLYKVLSKEERKSLRRSVGCQVSLLLRRNVEKAVSDFAEFFINIRTLEDMEDDLAYLRPSASRASIDSEVKEVKEEKKPPAGNLLAVGPIKGAPAGSKGVVGTRPELSGRNTGKQAMPSLMHLEKMELQKPDFMHYQGSLFPVLRIDMVYEEGILKFKESEEYIKMEVGTLFRGIVEAFNNLLHPEYTKIEVKSHLQGLHDDKKDETGPSATLPNEEREKRRLAAGNEETIFTANAEEVYSKFCEIVVFKEKLPKKKVVAFGLKEEPEPENLVPKHIKIADLDEEVFINIFEQIIEHITAHYIEAQQSFQIFGQFKPFFTKSMDKEIKLLFAKKNFVLEEYRNYLIVLKNFEDLLNKVPNSIYFPMFEINCKSVKDQLVNFIEDFKSKIFNKLESNIIEQFKSISEKYNSIVAYIRRDTDTPEEVELMEKFIYDLNFERAQQKSRASEAFRGLMAVFKLEHMGSDLLHNLAKEIHEWPMNLDKELKSAEEKHSVQRMRLEEKLRERRVNFEMQVEEYAEKIDQYTNFTEYGSYKGNVEQISEFEEQLNQADREMREIQDHEKKLFGIVSQYDKFTDLMKTLEPYVEFWNTVGEFLEAKKAWMYGSFKLVNPIDVETTVKVHVKSSNKLGKVFDKNPIAARLASEYKEDVQSMNEMLPIIEVLCNPGLTDRHWVQIEQMINAKFNPEEGNLKDILNKGVNQHLTQIEELSEQASKEFKLQTMLDKMEKEWEELRFVINTWKGTNVLILQGAALEDIMVVLDDHTLKAQTIRSNPNIKFMEERAIRWEKLMLFIQEVLDVWIKVQSSYLYLEPIFGSEDIIGQMPKEAKKFSEVDVAWKDIMLYVDRDPLVIHVERIPRLLERLNSSLLQIEEIQKGLNDYLERKRLDFPRFFFLSNEDLLNILAETKDPLLVQPHLKKCFEGINELIFSSGVEILGMRSSEGEEINFLEKISPKNYKSNVEQWLGKVEEQMRLSLQKVTEDSLNDLTKTRIPRAEWVVKWPGQIVICISQTLWTFTVEDKLKTAGYNGIKEYNEELKLQLEEVVALVRGNLTNQERITLGALIVIEVHARDVVQDLVNDRVTETEAFEWISQLRYYWEAADKRINVRMITSAMDYGNEYLGNTGRLVITPLTDRCYRTLMSALQLNLGGAPEGPAGTGKTETTKDLAKALAMQCVVFNCSEGLNAHAMAKFFKGLASAGAWSCFDEFNRIELEVLSVVAQQILEIQQAKNMGKRHFSFAGTQTLELKPTCNVFITMNPGYAGRSELPDNLKALFRPVAMMVPDYAMIAEISLYSYGFDQARDLARKIVATYKLCSEQLSSQDHYDYGMRAVKAVLTTAGQLKRKFILEKEDTLMLRSICDVNLPKFLTQDIQLFMGIISDLFPSVKAPVVDYGVLNETVNNSIHKFGLQNVPAFRKKIFQLYEMVNCRHGLMLVGQPFSGKTMCYRVLAKALVEAAATGESEEVAAQYHVINPKSLTIAQLYGYSDPISKEWTEGVLAEVFRKCATSTSPDRQWIVFDGPVDADWIENMNTVLDDNKKLCLMNGETIAMSNPMTMMFEVADLLQASPATVSRCGMIYMQPDNIGWWPLVVSWTMQYDQILDSIYFKHLEDLFDALLGKCIEFIKGKCSEYQSIPEGCLAVSAMRVMQALMTEHDMVTIEGLERLKPEEIIARMDQLFLYSIIWTVGATTTEAGRKLFSTFLKKLITDTIRCDNHKDRLLKLDKAAMLPEGSGSQAQDYYIEEWKWKNWKERLEKLDVPISPEMRYQDIVVPTTESLRINGFLKLAIAHRFPFLLIGPTGTGKSLFIGNHLKTLSLETNLIIPVTFSAQTTATQTQEIIDEKLEKIRKGIFGPGLGKKCLIFIDDLNMPGFDKYGAQPPIELLRQFFDHKGWYDRKDRKFKEIIETNILAAMGPPGGGRNVITPRMIRHFYVYATTESDDKTFLRIFNKIIDWHAAKQGLDTEMAKTLRFAVEGSIEVYLQICENLKPTPAKSHYLFNLRDLSRVVQGMLLLGKAQANDSKKLVRLWLHEICRVFYDRLTTEADQVWLFNLLVHTTKQKLREPDFKVLFKPLVKDEIKLNSMINSHEILKYLRFGDLMSEELNPHDRPYDEITDQVALQKRVERYLEEFNETSKKPMHLVMFEFAVDHILRICRLLKMSRSHALLVGLGGSGRQSLTRLAAFICEHDVFTVEVSKSYTFDQWRNDIKRLLISAGVDLKFYVFLLTDRHIVGNYVLEDLNNLLNSGDVPNVIPQEEFLPLIDKLRAQAKQEGKEDLYNYGTNSQFYDYFVENIKAHLHIVLVQSSIGDALRTRMRMFPSIVNCCTCVWYKVWPEEALHAVAQKFVLDLGMEGHAQRGMINSVKFMHESVKKLSDDYLRVEGRYNYITPTSYLELLSSLKNLLETQRKKLNTRLESYIKGVEKLVETGEEVKNMEKELIDKRPVLIQMKEENSKLSATIEKNIVEMEPKRLQVEQEEAYVNGRVEQAEVIRRDCQHELDQALPLVDKAKKALQNIDPNDIINLRSMLKPPVTVQLVLHAVCVLLGEKPIRVNDPDKPGSKIDSYWEKSKKLLADYKAFLNRLLDYDIEHIDSKMMEQVRTEFLSRTNDFNPQRVEKASGAAKGLCEWVIALSKYEKVLAIVRPKQEEYDRACREVNELKKNLKEKTDELNKLNLAIKDLQDRYEQTRKKQAELEDDINMCQKKLDRAQVLTGSLGGERDRWSEAVVEYHNKVKYVVGDVLLSAGTISYLAPFSSVYRSRIQRDWIDMVRKNDIQVSENYSLEQSLGEPVLIRKWVINGLPSDSFSKENGIIMANAGRYSLMIDPQNQANKWIKNNEAENELRVVKQSDSDFVKTLENAVTFGWVLLIENVHEELDAILEPILMKQTFKTGGVLSIKIGENIVDYNKAFRLFMTTKLKNPHYPPEVSIKITLVNFMITKEGLDDQLLEIAVAKENPDLEEMRSKLIVQSAENQRQLEEIENKILGILRTSQGNILNDEEAINVLAQSKTISKDIEEKQKSAEVTEKKIEEARTGYKPIALHSRVLFFALMSLSNIEVVYQYSLTWFIQLFLNAFNQAEKSSYLLQRVNNVIETLTYSVYTNVCRSLFEKDKLLFSFVLTHAVLESKGKINPKEFSFFITPQSSTFSDTIPPNPLGWLSDVTWVRFYHLSKVTEYFKDILQSLKQEEDEWKQIYNDQEAHKRTFPAPFQTCSHMQRLCILKVLRPDRVIGAIREFITSDMSPKFITPPTFDLNKSFSESVATQPLIFILPGTDPMNLLMTFAEQNGKANTLQKISLGQGQGPIAEKAIREARESAGWVILQNCHLAPSWMPELEKICENLESKAGKEKTHPSFRLWLTTYPSTDFPVSILQSSVKMTNEPPKGLKNNLMVSYTSDPINQTQEFYETNSKPKEFKSLLFGLCMFHAVLQERRNYGSLGWNIHYDFNQSDLRISVKQLHLFLDNYKGVPFKALHYLTGECNYGGRVTDDRDRRILRALIEDFYSDNLLKSKYAFAGLSAFSLPDTGSYENVLKYLENMPLMAPAELFGFHSNAEISKDLKETNEMCYNLLLIGGGSQAGSKDGESDESKLKKICDDILAKLPKEFNPELVKAKYPVSYANSMNTVLNQEIIRYNRLTSTITSSLKNIEQALKGLQVMSEQLEKVTQSLLRGLVPDMWKKRSYPSLKPLGSYIHDLVQRLTYFQKWIELGYPNVYWISGFFFTQSFLTGVLQNYARKHTIPIDNLTFDFEFLDEPPANPDELKDKYQAPEEGCYIYGLFLEGCRWDYEHKRLEESHLKVLYSQAPIIWLRPVQQGEVREGKYYKCPVYKTTERKGTLSTTGHSTNFIMTVNMDTDRPESHWIKRGVAMICQLSD